MTGQGSLLRIGVETLTSRKRRSSSELRRFIFCIVEIVSAVTRNERVLYSASRLAVRR